MLAGTSHTATGIAAVGQAEIVPLARTAITIPARLTHPETDIAPVGRDRPVDINALVEESLNLAYHGARAEKQGERLPKTGSRFRPTKISLVLTAAMHPPFPRWVIFDRCIQCQFRPMSAMHPEATKLCTDRECRNGPTAEVGRVDLWLPGQPRRLLSSTPFQSSSGEWRFKRMILNVCGTGNRPSLRLSPSSELP